MSIDEPGFEQCMERQRAQPILDAAKDQLSH